MSLNVNTILTIVVAALVVAGLENGWQLNKTQVQMQADQKSMAQQLEAIVKQHAEMMPRTETETRLRMIDASLNELRVRVTAVELEVTKLRERK